ncbi:MAG: hypothetical protein LM590_16805, partial [Thermofilum sp.]|nr:hypothetical protein [Thermofilum sp.]
MASEGFGRALSGAVWLTAYSLLNAAGGRWAPLLVPLSLSSGPVLGALVAAGSYRSAFAFQALGSLAKLLLALAGFPPLPAVFLSSLASLAFGLALAALKLGFARPSGWRGVFVVAAGNYLLNFSGGFAASLGVV